MYFIGFIFVAALAAVVTAFVTDRGFKTVAPTIEGSAEQQLQAYAKKRAREQDAQ